MDECEPTAHRCCWWQVKTVDFSQWLLRSFRAEDHVTLNLDAAGAEFEVLERMVEDGSLLLVDRIHVKWNDAFRPEMQEWPELCSHAFELLGIQQGKPGAFAAAQ
jgi:hypothetical protein